MPMESGLQSSFRTISSSTTIKVEVSKGIIFIHYSTWEYDGYLSHLSIVQASKKPSLVYWLVSISLCTFGGAINHLARHGLGRGLLKLKFEKDHLCSACALGKSSKKPHKPKSEDTNQEKLYLLHMDLS
ncbi:hypothetical protein Tco_0154186 [Tanacetum coccineum]